MSDGNVLRFPVSQREGNELFSTPNTDIQGLVKAIFYFLSLHMMYIHVVVHSGVDYVWIHSWLVWTGTKEIELRRDLWVNIFMILEIGVCRWYWNLPDWEGIIRRIEVTVQWTSAHHIRCFISYICILFLNFSVFLRHDLWRIYKYFSVFDVDSGLSS